MESTVAVMETCQNGNSNLVAKPVESPIKIDSISIDLIKANDDVDTGKCDHFSIRGYVSEKRKKDWKKCWPFALDGCDNLSEEQNSKLPPLLVPRFRWWCCQYCLQEIEAEGGVNEERTVANNSSKLKLIGTCPHMSSHGDTATWLSDLQQAGMINIESRKHNANACGKANSSDCHFILISDKKEKKAETANIPIIGKKDVLGSKINKEIHMSNSAGVEVISSLMQQTLHLDDKVASLQLHEPVGRDNGSASGKLTVSNPACPVRDSIETHQVGKCASACDQQMELVRACGTEGTASMVRVPDAIKTPSAEHPSLELDDCDCASSESAEILGTASGSLNRRKTRKVRLLTELLGKNEDEKVDLTSVEGSPPADTPDASPGLESISAPLGQISFRGNVTSNFGHSRKRKLPQDEEWRPGEMSSPNNGHRNLRTFKRGEETADEIASSDSEGTINGSASQTAGARSHFVNFKGDKVPIVGKKKSKRTQNSDECLSVSLSRENLQKERQKKPGDASKSNATNIALYKSNSVSIGGGSDNLPESAQEAEKRSCLLKRKSKVHQNHDGHASPVPWKNCMLREGRTSRKDVEIRQSGSISVPPKVTQDAPAEKELHFSLNNCLPEKRYDGKNIAPNRDGLQTLLPWQGVLSKDEIGRKDLKINYSGGCSFPSKSELDACHWKGMHVDMNSHPTTYRIPFLNEKQKHSSYMEVGGCSRIQQLDYSGTSNNGKNLDLRECSAVARKHYDQRAEMVSEQGTLDDIPMEIVELMAKNQYERCLPDSEIDKRLSETTNNTRHHQRVDLNKVYATEELSLFHETTQKPKPRAKNGKFGKTARGDNVGPSRQKSGDCFSHMERHQFKMGQLEQSYSPAGFRPFPLCGEKSLNGINFSATSSSRQNSSQNCQWNGHIVGQRSSHASVQAMGVCNTCQSAPQQNKEVAHLWQSMMPNKMSYLYGIPQKCADQVADIDLLSHSPSNLPKGSMNGNDRNFLSLASNFDKHSRKFDSEVLRKTHADYPFACKHNAMGSLDLYSNETIPAMHLLSLMDAGLQSGAPVDADGNQRYAKKTSFLHSHQSKEFSSLPAGGYRSNTMKHPSYGCYGKNHLPENFCECMSATPTVGPSTSSFHHDRSLKKANDFTGQFSLKSRDKEKKKYSDTLNKQNRNRRQQKTISSSSGLNTTCGSFPVHSMPKLVLGTSDFMMFPVHFNAMESATRHKEEVHSMSGTLFHPKSGSENEICSINRNPADFTVPEAGNMYMIRGEDLKFGREAPSSSVLKLVGQKRQKKLTVRKEHSRNRTS